MEESSTDSRSFLVTVMRAMSLYGGVHPLMIGATGSLSAREVGEHTGGRAARGPCFFRVLLNARLTEN